MDVEKEEVIAGATAAAGTADAAAITSGLATVGGGGMTVGLVITAAAPIVVGTAVFFLLRLLRKQLEDINIILYLALTNKKKPLIHFCIKGLLYL